MHISGAVLDWLLEPENPSVRYRTMTEILDMSQDDRDVQQARAAVLTSRPVQKIFAKMHPDGYWLHRGVGAGIGLSPRSLFG